MYTYSTNVKLNDEYFSSQDFVQLPTIPGFFVNSLTSLKQT